MRLYLLGLATLLGLLAGSQACSDDSDSSRDVSGTEVPAPSYDSLPTVIERLSREHGAIVSEFPSSKPLTIELQESLIDHGRPVIVVASLVDIARRDTSYTCLLKTHGLRIWFDAYFRLDCTASMVNQLLELRRPVPADILERLYPSYAFVLVTQLTDVGGPTFGTSMLPLSTEEAEIEIEYADIVVFEGKLLDVEPAASDRFWVR